MLSADPPHSMCCCGQCVVLDFWRLTFVPIAVITSNKNLRHDNLDLVVKIFNLTIVSLVAVVDLNGAKGSEKWSVEPKMEQLDL